MRTVKRLLLLFRKPINFPPPGTNFFVDDNNNYFIDDSGNYFIDG